MWQYKCWAMVRSKLKRRIPRRASAARIPIISQWVVGLVAVSVCTQLGHSWLVCEHTVDSLPENPNTDLADGLASVYLLLSHHHWWVNISKHLRLSPPALLSPGFTLFLSISCFLFPSLLICPFSLIASLKWKKWTVSVSHFGLWFALCWCFWC